MDGTRILGANGGYQMSGSLIFGLNYGTRPLPSVVVVVFVIVVVAMVVVIVVVIMVVVVVIVVMVMTTMRSSRDPDGPWWKQDQPSARLLCDGIDTLHTPIQIGERDPIGLIFEAGDIQDQDLIGGGVIGGQG